MSMIIGAWAGSWALANPTEAVDLLHGCGLRRVDVILNDHSKRRRPSDFGMRDERDVEALTRIAQSAGMTVHALTWIMPHERYLLGMRDRLQPLAHELGLASVVADAEEPWTLAVDPMPYLEAAELVRSLWEAGTVALGATGIGHAPHDKLWPLLAVCRDAYPQCYATRSSVQKYGIDPRTVVQKFAGRWRDRFGAHLRILPGLAAYRQTSIPGWSTADAMLACLHGAEAIGAEEVVYWQAKSLRVKSVAKVLRAFTTARAAGVG